MALVRMAQERPWIKESQLKSLEELVENAETFFNEKLQQQEALQPYEDPVLISEQMSAKLRPITTMTSDLLRIRKPKEPKAPAGGKNATSSAASEESSGEESSNGSNINENEEQSSNEESTTQDQPAENEEKTENTSAEEQSSQQQQHEDL